jgi:hypothetical protein
MDRVDYQALIIQDIINLEARAELNLAPWYQRRSVWSTPQKSYLVNTLLERKPIPAIYIRHSLDLDNAKSIKEVVDGQQRTRAIISYYNNEFSARHPNYPRKIYYNQLKREEQQLWLLTSIPVGYLLGATDADVIDIFGRINSISKTLNPQEKRNAAFSGEMKQFCLEQASSRTPFWREYEIFSATDISRMSEVLFISDLVFNLMNGLSDYSPANLNNMYSEYDEEFDDREDLSNELDRLFDIIGSLDRNLITDTIFNRQPLFFSLLMAVHQTARISMKKLSTAINNIDERFHSEVNRTRADDNFKDACISTTQRIAQRRVRDQYIKSFF